MSLTTDASLQRMLNLEPAQLLSAHHQLCKAGLVVYHHPLYQVLALELPLEPGRVGEPAARSAQPLAAGDILRRLVGGGQ